MDQTEQIRRLEAEVAGLRRALRTRSVIEQAKGLLAERHGIDPEEAFGRLVTRSQQTNVAVVDLAADVVGVRLGATDDAVGVDAADDTIGVRLGATDDAGGVRLGAAARLRAEVGAATDPAELVRAFGEQTWLGARAVSLYAAQAGGSLRLLAAQGWTAAQRHDLQWIPSAVRTPASEAIRRGEPVWLRGGPDGGPDGLLRPGPGAARAALPVLVAGVPVAAVEVAFADPAVPDEPQRRALAASAAALSTWFATAPEAALLPAADDQAAVLLDALAVPAALFSPVWTDDGTIDDFRIERANPPAVGLWRPAGPVEGRRLLDTKPAALRDGTFDALVRAYQGFGPTEDGPRVRAVRVGGRLLATWLADPPVGESIRLHAMERLGGFGWAEWTPSGEPVTWSVGLSRVLGRAAARPPLPLARLIDLVGPADRARLRGAVEAALRGRPGAPLGSITVEVKVTRPVGGPRALRIALGLRTDHNGHRRLLCALVQDRTEARQHARTAAQLAASRLPRTVDPVGDPAASSEPVGMADRSSG